MIKLISSFLVALSLLFVNSVPAMADTNSDLLDASGKGDVSAMQTCLRNGAEVNYQTPTGNTALMFAVRGQKIEAIKFLLVNGASVLKLKDNVGQNAYDLAKARGNQAVVASLQSKYDEESKVAAKEANSNPWVITAGIAAGILGTVLGIVLVNGIGNRR